jgi:hypothetical protein
MFGGGIVCFSLSKGEKLVTIEVTTGRQDFLRELKCVLKHIHTLKEILNRCSYLNIKRVTAQVT